MRKTNGKANRKDCYTMILESVLAMLARGVIPWRKTWKGTGPRSLSTGKAYRGLNVFFLAYSESGPFGSQWWGTFRQVTERRVRYLREQGVKVEERKRARGKGTYSVAIDTDGTESPVTSVRKGQKGTPIFFWRWIVRKDEKTGKERSIPFLRHYTVFNSEQCEPIALPAEAESAPTVPACEGTERLRAMFAEYVERSPGLTVSYGGDRAYYDPASDHVQVPDESDFESLFAFLSTHGHEFGHSTGHGSRLNRDGVTDPIQFGSHTYSREELVAEFTSAFLFNLAGVDAPDTLENNAAYIAHWSAKLRDDPRAIVVAAGRAQKAADLISGVVADQESGDDSADESSTVGTARATA